MKKYLFASLFCLFLPHFMVWSTVLASGFSVDYKATFNDSAFWAAAGIWWACAGTGVICAIFQSEDNKRNPKNDDDSNYLGYTG